MKANTNKKKKWPWVLGILLGVLVLAGIIGPYILLNAATKGEAEEDYAYKESFYTDYESVRANLKDRVENLKQDGYEPVFYSHPIDEADGLYIDNIYLPSKEETNNLLVFTTGVHGIEGYIGSVMMDVFFEELYQQIDINNTGVLVIANVNPYGMKYLRRYNENNVDLNRNFILDWDAFDLATNKDYPKVVDFLGPKSKIGNALWHEVGFYGSLAKYALTVGADTVSDALLGGQYEYPEGVYYGGNGDEASTVFLKDAFTQCLKSSYDNIIHIDVHSGYGPRYNMIIFNSVFETMNEAESVEAFGYDYVLAYDSEGFYPTTGDTTDYFYRLAQRDYSNKSLYSTCFEFGTVGDAFFDTILSLKYTVDENRQHWYPTNNAISEQIVAENYWELYYPAEGAWREKTVEDFKTATQGILKTKLK